METFDPLKNTTEVRQGSRRMANSRVLVISLVAVVIAFALIFLFYQMMPEGNVIAPGG